MKKGKGFFRWLGHWDKKIYNKAKHLDDTWSKWAIQSYMHGYMWDR